MKVLLPYLKKNTAGTPSSRRWPCWCWSLRPVAAAAAANGDDCIMAKDRAAVWQNGIWLIVLAAIGIVGGVVNTVYSARLALGVATDLRADIYRHVQSFAYADVETFSASNLVVRMTNDVQQIQGAVMAAFQQVTRIPLLFFGALALALTTMPQQWWVILAMLVIIVLVAVVAFRQMSSLFGRTQQLIENVNTVARENLMGIRVVKSFVQEDNQIKTFAKPSDELRDVTTRIGELFAVLMPAFFS